MVNVSVAGATGYAGGEFLRLMTMHPELELAHACAHSSTGRLGEHQPHLLSLADVDLEPLDPQILADSDVVVLGLPHGASGEIAAQIAEINPQAILIDLGADHRLTCAADWDQYYGGPFHDPWTYGIPELAQQRTELSGTQRIACPGCNASAVTLAAQPLVAAGLSDGTGIVATLAVGYSGAGKKLAPHLLASQALGNVLPYSSGGSHRHIPEIAQNLRLVGGQTTNLVLTPVLAPISRGILATVHVPTDATSSEVADAFGLYESEPFIHVVAEPPSVADVVGSNQVLMYPVVEPAGGVTIMCALDNLGKGTAGAAIQSLNLALGLPETCGLEFGGVAP